MNYITLFHSNIRWALIAVALSTIVLYILCSTKVVRYSRIISVFSTAFAGLLDLQTVLGLILLTIKTLNIGAGYIRFALPHIISMLLAVATAHIAARWSKSPDKVVRTLIATFVTLLLILSGVREITGEWLG